MRTYLFAGCLVPLVLLLSPRAGAAPPAPPAAAPVPAAPSPAAPSPAPAAPPTPGPAADRGMQARYFPDYDLQSCQLFRLAPRGLHEFCAVSQPAKDGARRFVLTVRNPTRMEKKGSAKAALVASLPVPAAPGEYLDYRRAGLYDLAPGLHLVFISLLTGVPEQAQRARPLFYAYSEPEHKFIRLWEPAPCAGPCTEEVDLALSAEGQSAQIDYTQIAGGERKTQSQTIALVAPAAPASPGGQAR